MFSVTWAHYGQSEIYCRIYCNRSDCWTYPVNSIAAGQQVFVRDCTADWLCMIQLLHPAATAVPHLTATTVLLGQPECASASSPFLIVAAIPNNLSDLACRPPDRLVYRPASCADAVPLTSLDWKGKYHLTAHGRGDAAPGSQRELLLEAQAAYATGLLAALVEDPATSQVPPRHRPLPTRPAQVACA